MEIDPTFRLALWGCMGAFWYAGPRWTACLGSKRARGGGMMLCTLELFVALLIGSGAGAVLTQGILTAIPFMGENAVAALVGFVFIPASPAVLKRLTTLAARLAGDRSSISEVDK